MDFAKEMEKLVKKNPFMNKTDIVYSLVLQGILDGKLIEGQKLLQNSISSKLGISRTPVRNALSKLCADGFLLQEGTCGYKVYNLKLEDYLSLNDFRTMLEVYSVELAVKNLNRNDVQFIRQNLIESAKAMQKEDVDAFAVLDIAFHDRLILASRNRYIIDTYNHFKSLFRLFGYLTLGKEMLPVAQRWHQKIFDEIELGEVEKAVTATRLHRENTVDGALTILRKNKRG